MAGKGFSVVAAVMLCAVAGLAGCAAVQPQPATQVVYVEGGNPSQGASPTADGSQAAESGPADAIIADWSDVPADGPSSSSSPSSADASELRARLDIVEDMREGFVHGEKPAKFQKYIVMHDTEGEGEPEGVVSYWDGAGTGVAAHFVVGVDGHIVQCVPLDKIAHHAGFGDTGHNEKFGVEDESRDDKVGTEEIGEWASDYGMNSYSVGIEMVHVGGEGDYPEAQLEAVDALIAYIDASFGKECEIIDHKMWRSGNSDTSEEFAECLENLRDHRTTRS